MATRWAVPARLTRHLTPTSFSMIAADRVGRPAELRVPEGVLGERPAGLAEVLARRPS